MNYDTPIALGIMALAVLWLLWGDIIPRARRNAAYRAARRASMKVHPAGRN